jgi:hypothetical protein
MSTRCNLEPNLPMLLQLYCCSYNSTGYYPICVRMMTKVLDSYCLTDIITRIIMYLPDYKLMKEEDAKRAAASAKR